jgi:hypothetical protein
MVETQILNTLRTKRDELERIIGSYEKAIEWRGAISRRPMRFTSARFSTIAATR